MLIINESDTNGSRARNLRLLFLRGASATVHPRHSRIFLLDDVGCAFTDYITSVASNEGHDVDVFLEIGSQVLV
jgi:hypothetical protein